MSAGAFTGLRPGALGDLVAPLRVPRRRAHLDALALAVELSSRADFRSGVVEGGGVMALAAGSGRTWRRQRAALDALGSVGLVRLASDRLSVDLARFVHQRHKEDGPWIKLTPGAISHQALHHGLSRVATDVYTHLVLEADDEHTISDTSQSALARACATGWPTMHDSLDELSEAGLVNAAFCRGQRVVVTVTGRPAVVQPAPVKRAHRRERHHAAHHGGAADQAGAKLWRHFELSGLPASGLIAALRKATREGAPLGGVVEHVVAGGGLARATDPASVLVWRVHQAAQAYKDAQEAQEAAIASRKAQEAAQAALVADYERQGDLDDQDSRWLASVLGPRAIGHLAHELAAIAFPKMRRVPKAMLASLVLDWGRRAVVARSDLSPADAIHYALEHGPPLGPAPPIGQHAVGSNITDALA